MELYLRVSCKHLVAFTGVATIESVKHRADRIAERMYIRTSNSLMTESVNLIVYTKQ